MRFVRPFAHVPELVLAWLTCAASGCVSVPQASFDTPHEAMHAVVRAAETNDSELAEQLFGADGIEFLRSGDEVADQEDIRRIQQAVEEKLDFDQVGPDTAIALIGNDAWPFPIPLVRDAGAWRFDVEAGVEELTNRRVGRNELSTLATLHAYVDAQHEYASQSRDGKPRSFARRLVSTADTHDGLYWPVADGEAESPLGGLIAAAAYEGYSPGGAEPEPYHGYYYRSLDRQGPSAPGGAKAYIDDQGLMPHGFALMAWPAKYGNSGVMTFLVGRNGIVFQRDLGADTETTVATITAFDPDGSWTPTSD